MNYQTLVPVGTFKKPEQPENLEQPLPPSHRRFSLQCQYQCMVFSFLPVFFHREAVGGAAFGAHAADHAFFSINGPGAVLPINGNSTCGTIVFTTAAEEALVNIIFHMKWIV